MDKDPIQRASEIRTQVVNGNKLFINGRGLPLDYAHTVAAWARVALANTSEGGYKVDYTPHNQMFNVTPIGFPEAKDGQSGS